MYKQIKHQTLKDSDLVATCKQCGSKRMRYGGGKVTCAECGENLVKGTSKYKNTRQTFGGFNYDSKFEANVAGELTLRERVGDIKGWERQKVLPLRVNGKLVCNYKIDFVVEHVDGTIELLEAKGFPTEAWKIKWKLLEAVHEELYPGSRLTVVRQSDSKR